LKDFKALRKESGFTQTDIAVELGIKTSTVSMWETGDSLPRADKLSKLAKLFGCTVDDLLKSMERKEEIA
jgi:Predicted transcriptional regulators